MRAEVAEEVEREAVELALALAGKIVVATLQIRPELVVEVLQGALRRVSSERTMAIVVNPVDVETVRGALGELQSQSTATEQWDLQADQRVPAGGAIVRTVESEVDARIHTQLERAREVVEAEIGPARARAVSAALGEERPLARAAQAIRDADLARRHGFVTNLIGLIIEVTGLQAEIGEVCVVGTERGRGEPVPAEVVGFREGRTLLMPLGELHGIGPGHPGAGHGRAVPDRRRRSAAGPYRRRPRPARRRAPGGHRRAALDDRRAADGPVAAADHRARRPRRARARHARALRSRPAAGHLRRVGRRQVLAARHDRPLHLRPGERDRARRRARPRGAGVRRARPRRRASSARSSSSPPPTSRRWCASRRPSRRPRSPSTSATRATT